MAIYLTGNPHYLSRLPSDAPNATLGFSTLGLEKIKVKVRTKFLKKLTNRISLFLAKAIRLMGGLAGPCRHDPFGPFGFLV